MKNGKKIKLIPIFIICVMCVLCCTGCTVFDNFKASFIDSAINDDEIIYIGVIEPQTGSMSENGKDEIKGIELANSIYNNVSGYKVKLSIVDTKSTTGGAKSAIQSLIKLDPVAIIGSVGEASSLVASEYISKAEIPAITASCVNPLITQDNGYYFRACITGSQMGAGLSEYAYSVLAARKIAVIDIKNDNTISAIIEGFKDDITVRSGGNNPIVLDTEIESTDKDSIKKILKKVKKSKAEAVFLPIGKENAEDFFTAIEDMGLTDVVFLGTKAWANKDFANIANEHPSVKIAFPSDYVVGENKSTNNAVTAETERFLIEYANKYGSEDTPTQYAALGYDAYLLIMNAISDAASIKHKAVRDALANTNGIQCSTGVFRFDESGNTIRSVNIATVSDGEIITVYTTIDTSQAEKIKELEE